MAIYIVDLRIKRDDFPQLREFTRGGYNHKNHGFLVLSLKRKKQSIESRASHAARSALDRGWAARDESRHYGGRTAGVEQGELGGGLVLKP